jgi:phosphoribosylanthranilate isomerase
MTTPTPKIKICCISSPEEAALAVAAGVHALGLVSRMPSGPGVIDESLIADIACNVPPGIDTFLLTALTEAEAIAEQHARCGTTTLQLVDAVPVDELTRLSRLRPAARLVQVIHVRGPQSLDEALSVAPHVDALLLDSGNPDLAVKELGGTGRVHDWQVSAEIVRRVNIPVFLAGGLHAGNARAAIEAVRPHGLDICSGVREGGRLSAARLSAFVQAVRAV